MVFPTEEEEEDDAGPDVVVVEEKEVKPWQDDPRDEFRELRTAKLPYRTACWAPDEVVDEFQDSLNILDDYAAHLKSLPPMTKKIHVIWVDKSGSDIWNYADTPMVQHGVMNLKKMNPDWEFEQYNLTEIEDYLQEHLAKSDWEMMKPSPLIPKTDLFRLLKMYHEGGLYQDVDRLYNIPLSQLLTPDTKLLLPTLYDVTFTLDFLCSSRGNRLYERAIALYLCKLREEHGEGLTQWDRLNPSQLHSVAQEAAATYWAAVMEMLFGRPIWGPVHHAIDGDEGRAFASHVRSLIAANPHMLTYREQWCDLITSKHPNCTWISKDSLFNAAKVRQWDGG